MLNRFMFGSFSLARYLGLLILILILGRSVVQCDDVASGRGGADSIRDSLSLVRDARIEFIQASRGPPKAAAARELFFATRSVAEIKRLALDTDDGVALTAAWMCLVRSVNARRLGLDRSTLLAPVPDAISHEFLGFVVGRLRVNPPDLWLQNLSGTRMGDYGSALFPVRSSLAAEERDDGSNPIKAMETGRFTVPHADLYTYNETTYVRIKGNEDSSGQDAEAVLPDSLKVKLIELKKGGMFRLKGIANKEFVVLLLQDGVGTDGEIVCFPIQKSGTHPKVAWQSELDAYWGGGASRSTAYSELRLLNGDVFAFHSTHESIGIECLRLKDGSRRFSFNSWF